MTSFIGNKDGFDCSISSLDIFSPVLTQEEVSEGFWKPIAQKNTLDKHVNSVHNKVKSFICNHCYHRRSERTG